MALFDRPRESTSTSRSRSRVSGRGWRRTLHNTVQARYVRVSMTKPSGAKGIGIRELVVT